MELLILKNGAIFARATAADGDAEAYSLVALESVPEYPTEKPGKGKQWELAYNEETGASWALVGRPLTAEERLSVIEEEVQTIKKAWKAGESVVIGDKRYYNGSWYECLQAHTTQADWTPDAAVSLWKKE